MPATGRMANPRRFVRAQTVDLPAGLFALLLEVEKRHPARMSRSAIVRLAIANGLAGIYADIVAFEKARAEAFPAAPPLVLSEIRPPDEEATPSLPTAESQMNGPPTTDASRR